MQRSRSAYEAQSPQSSEHQNQYPAITAVQQHLASKGHPSAFSECFGDVLDRTSMQLFFDSNTEANEAQANTSNHYGVASSSFDGQRSATQPRQSQHQHSEGARRGIVEYTESPGLHGASREARSTGRFISGAAASPYSMHRRSHSTTSHRSVFTPMTNSLTATVVSAEARTTPYKPYRRLFADTDAARAHRHFSTRFGRQPYIPPEEDDTIGQVERDRTLNVGRIYDAMICGDRAQDNPGSIAMKRWVTGAHYKPDLVEAFAHKVFDCLLVQVKEGFRGWHHNDYVDDDRKGEKEDREANCAHRLEYIIDALEREKTVCEDVVNSASQIRMFVNAPIAYAQRKVQNRQGNSKRGRAKDASDPNQRPATRRKTGARLVNRSVVTPDRPMSRDATPQFEVPVPTGPSCYPTDLFEQPQLSTPGCLTARQGLQNSANSINQVPTGFHQATVTAPPTMARPYMPAITASVALMSPPMVPSTRHSDTHYTPAPTAQMLSAQMSTPFSTPQTYTYHSAPVSPEDAKYLPGLTSSPADWPTGDTVDTVDTSGCAPVDPSLSTDEIFTPESWSNKCIPVQDTDNNCAFDQQCSAAFVSLADLENTTAEAVNGTGDNVFVSNWNSIDGVQPFFFD